MSCCGDREQRRAQALAHLARAHAAGALGDVAAGEISLGSLTPGEWFPNPKDVTAEEDAFDGRLNAWLADYQQQTGSMPPALSQQVDDFVDRWRAFRASFNVFSSTRAGLILGYEAEFNGFVDQVATSTGKASVVTPAMVSVDGKQVRADQVPPGSSTLDRVEGIAKWAALLVGGVAAYKIANDLGLVTKVARLFSGGGAASSGGAVRRFGSAKRA